MRKTGHPGVPKGKCGNIGYIGTKIVLIRGAAVPMGTRSYFDGYFSQIVFAVRTFVSRDANRGGGL